MHLQYYFILCFVWIKLTRKLDSSVCTLLIVNVSQVYKKKV